MTMPTMRMRFLTEEEAASVKDKGVWHGHPVLVVDGVDCCGDSWCQGACGFPAAVLPGASEEGEPYECKLYGSMVACGYIVQRFRVEWKGAKYVVDAKHDYAALRKRMWF